MINNCLQCKSVKIAIGSGGLFGKGYLEGTQTKGGLSRTTTIISLQYREEWDSFGLYLLLDYI